MTKISIVKSFSKLPDAALGVKAQGIIGMLTNNPNFLAPIPPLAEINEAIVAYDAALAGMAVGGKDKTALKNEKREVLLSLLFNLGVFVEQNCQDNEVIALSSGYSLAKKPSKIGNLPKPEMVEVTDGEGEGEVEIKVSRVKGAKSYLYSYTLDPITDHSIWQSIPSSKTKTVIKNLESVKKYWFKVAAVGTTDNLNFSEEVSRVVQ